MQFKQGEAPKVTPQAIRDEIASVTYFTAAEGAIAAGQPTNESLELLTLCVITLRNGFTVLGKSACASPENFDRLMGQEIAYNDAFNQVWALMGYELRSQLARAKTLTDGTLGEALTRLMAHRLGNPEALRAEDADIILDHVTEEGDAGDHSA